MTEWVISGISGKFPDCDNLDEFWKNLVEHVDMVTHDDRRWKLEAYEELPTGMGKLKSLLKFDAEFFAVHGKQADVMEPGLRMSLEVCQEAILDAGINPSVLWDSDTGVYAAASSADAEAILKRSSDNPSGYVIVGSLLSMYANRISFSFNFHGPSYTVDSACSSAFTAIQNAHMSLKHGLIPTAVVSCSRVILCPLHATACYNYGIMSPDSKCKAFDASANGIVRSEAMVVMYICPRKEAKRLHCTIVHVVLNHDGYKKDGITVPKNTMQAECIKQVYEESGVNPLDVDYVEANAMGNPIGDKEEAMAIGKVFCKGRNKTLLVGAVKTNIGHTEYASGTVSIVKVIMAHREGLIPANLHYETPNPDIPEISDGRIQIVSENTPFEFKYVGINSFGMGGSNAHLLLRFDERAQATRWQQELPPLILASGRNIAATEFFLKSVIERKKSKEFIGLIHETTKSRIARHFFRGYTLLVEGSDPELIVEERKEIAVPEVWYVVTGLGNAWEGIRRDLLRLEVFQNSMKKSAEILSHAGFDLEAILNAESSSILDDMKNAIVTITAMQVALIDVLKYIKLLPDGIIGHSTGECACAYADDCFTQEQTVLVSLGRVRSFLESDLQRGALASVGLSWDAVQERVPPNIYAAIHNSPENVTIAGPTEEVKEFVEKLQEEGVFAKLVPSAQYAFHSPHIYPCEARMRELLDPVVPEPLPRSAKWLSSSVPKDDWDTELAKYSSVDYHINNTLKPVRLADTLAMIPNNSVVLEIAPNGFMQSILKRGIVVENFAVIGLMSFAAKDTTHYFLTALGRIYVAGANFDLGALYEPLEYPVTCVTPFIGPMVKWNHDHNWEFPDYRNELNHLKPIRLEVDLNHAEDEYFSGHAMDGRTVYPVAGYIWLVWKTWAKVQESALENTIFIIEDMDFKKIVPLTKDTVVYISASVAPGSGTFEVLDGAEEKTLIATGIIRRLENEGEWAKETFENEDVTPETLEGPHLTREDFYKDLSLRGYKYSGLFNGVRKVDVKGDWSIVDWYNNWVTFFDAALQMLHLDFTRDLWKVKRIERFALFPKKFRERLAESSNVVALSRCKYLKTIWWVGCLEIRRFFADIIPRKDMSKSEDLHLRENKFQPYTISEAWGIKKQFFDPLDYQEALAICFNIVVDNNWGRSLLFTEILSDYTATVAIPLRNYCPPSTVQIVELQLVSLDPNPVPYQRIPFVEEQGPNAPKVFYSIYQKTSVVISLEQAKAGDQSQFVFIDSPSSIPDALELLENQRFLLLKLNNGVELTSKMVKTLTLAARYETNQDCTLYLYHKITEQLKPQTLISVDGDSFSWIQELKSNLHSAGCNPNQRIILYSNVSRTAFSGLAGLVKCLILETGTQILRSFHIALNQNLEVKEEVLDERIQYQLRSDLVFNVLHGIGEWGSYFDIPWTYKPYPVPVKAAFIDASTLGDVSTLEWVESPLTVTENVGELCDIKYAAVNNRDMMLTTGQYPKCTYLVEPDYGYLGIEYSGIHEGKRICGVGKPACLSTNTKVDPDLHWEIPEDWSFEDAATVPVAYSLAYYALKIRGEIKPEERVLIHGACGAVGLAAINICLSMNCDIYVTVSSQAKRDFLQKLYPQLADNRISDSRSEDFEELVKMETDGKGVDIVLNTLTGDMLHAGLRLLDEFARFVEIVKYNMVNNVSIGLAVFLPNVQFQSVCLEGLFIEPRDDGDEDDKLETVRLVRKGIKEGVVIPLPRTVFEYSQIQEAVHYMADRNHVGKIILKIENVLASRRSYFHWEKSYLIIGGLGGWALELIDWMFARGARKFLLNSRQGSFDRTTYHEYRFNYWKSKGVEFEISHTEANTEEGATQLLEESQKLGTLGGIFNCASLVKEETPIKRQTPEDFKEVALCKVDITVQLDKRTREVGLSLDYFVVFSSTVAGLGSLEQASFGWANSAMEEVIKARREDDLPGIAVRWGNVDVGQSDKDAKGSPGLDFQTIYSCYTILDQFLVEGAPVMTSYQVPFTPVIPDPRSSDSEYDEDDTDSESSESFDDESDEEVMDNDYYNEG